MKRRAFLRGAGIVTVLVAEGGVWRAWDQGVFRDGAALAAARFANARAVHVR